jgi:transposase-like protein
MLDATYFNKKQRGKEKTRETCLIVLMDYETKKPFYWEIIEKENGESVKGVLIGLRELGLNPLSFTTDGLPATIRAIREVYPNVVIQRCLAHIIRQSLSWLRTNPKSEAGKELKSIVKTIGEIRSEAEQEAFIDRYFAWHNEHREFIEAHYKNSVASKDLKRTTSVVNASKDLKRTSSLINKPYQIRFTI